MDTYRKCLSPPDADILKMMILHTIEEKIVLATSVEIKKGISPNTTLISQEQSKAILFE
ncbi:MAG: hypothetical protein JW776_12390 [Candidatus Lokiarchaeota archaeon]|nr:hypothetical protein [Candidatus Lokiarchaeota archaeon]